MSLLNQNNWSLFGHLDREVERMLAGGKSARPAEEAWQPRVDIIEDEKGYLLVADLPGIDPAEIEISMERGVLSIKGKRAYQAAEEARFNHRERLLGEFQRQFRIPESIDVEGIKAIGRHGVLEVSIPKREAVQPRRIPVTH